MQRDLTTQSVRHYTEKTPADIGGYFDLTDNSTVSRVGKRIKCRDGNNRIVLTCLMKLRVRTNKGQGETCSFLTFN